MKRTANAAPISDSADSVSPALLVEAKLSYKSCNECTGVGSDTVGRRDTVVKWLMKGLR